MSLDNFWRRHRTLRAALRNLSFTAGILILASVVLVALSAPWLFPGDPLDMVGMPALWPGEDPAFPLGTDSLGRDVAAGLAHGARVSLLVGVSAAGIGLLIGTAIGAAAGYSGGWVDDLLVRVTELFQTVPAFLLVIVLVSIREPSAPAIAVAIGVASWPTVARLVRAQFRSLRSADFVAAALVSGARPSRIILRHILPNALPPIVVTTSVMVANAILTEAGLSFLNLGDPNLVSWGSMIGDGRQLLRTAWYLTALPGAAIALTVMSINLAGDGLNDVLNPRSGSH
ncbi:ABC transporter permease [Siccirubricoccus sp. KC 17139]|uniref:ABC transporter permease n=1 Tax=Siccirubricoccus soli TaxID=2899147 RepID=A0ABT1D942_9PROT|nr:ABC transporter permease [Siccirubricoccus soli]MCO6418449.1 ABC transporter permease [Siccirubricoccus soli]MCP2684584.1 ABC transporter permease [Siccirubricoccus soli]